MGLPTARITARCLLMALALVAGAGTACAPQPYSSETAWERDTRVTNELRAAGRHAEALAYARQVLARVERGRQASGWLRDDARRRVASLEGILALEPEALAQLARADRLRLSAAAAADSGLALRCVELAREELAIREQVLGSGHFETGAAASRAGGWLRDAGDYLGAQRHLARADSILRITVGTDHPQYADNLMGLAGLRRLQREPEAALELTQPALAIYARTLGPRTLTYATALLQHAGALRETTRRLAAGPLYDQAVAIIERSVGDRAPQYAAALHAMGNYRMRLMDFAGAEELLRRAVAMRRALLAPEHALVAWSLHDLGMALLSQQKLEEASACFRASLRIRKAVYGPEHPLLIEDLRHLPRLAMTLGRDAEADTLISEAIRAYEIVRRSAGTGLRQDLFFAPPYDQLAVLRLVQGREEEAWVPAELAQSRGLSSLLLAGERPDLSEGPPAWGADGEPGGQRPAGWEDLLLPGPRPITVRAVQGGAFDPRRVQSRLHEKSALVGWITAPLADERVVLAYAYVVRPRGPVRWVRLPEPPSGPNPFTLAAQVAERLQAAAAWPARVPADDRLSAELHHLWACCFQPLEPYLRDARELVVIPNYLFMGLPVEALIDSAGSPIGDRWSISYVPSATAFTWLRPSRRDRSASSAGPALLVGDPVAAPQIGGAARHASLPGAREGLETIAALLPGAIRLVGPAAREESLHALAAAGDLARCPVLVFFTHAHADREFIERSALVLSSGSAGTSGSAEMPEQDPGRTRAPDQGPTTPAAPASWADGLLTAGEISANYRLNAELVWLAGCGTGVGPQCSHESHLGLASAFLLAGARSLIVSLWPVDEEAAGLLATRYFQNLTAGRAAGDPRVGASATTKAEALSEARRWLRARVNARGERIYEHPIYWAGFILIGDPG